MSRHVAKHPPSLRFVPMARRSLVAFAGLPFRFPAVSRAQLSKRLVCTMAPPTTSLLVTWDIDGTLLGARGKSGNSAHKRAIDDAVNVVYGIATKVNDIPHAGSTDRAIIRDMCLAGGVKEDKIWAGMDHAIAEADKRVVGYVDSDLSHLVLPGVREALSELKTRGVTLALTTGNLESCAWEKVSAAGLKEFFVTGGFGSDCLLRTDILKLAMERVAGVHPAFEVQNGSSGGLENVFHVGDAIADMQAARENGARGIGVLTGAFSRQQLEEERPFAILEDLSDTDRFLGLLGLEGNEQDALYTR